MTAPADCLFWCVLAGFALCFSEHALGLLYIAAALFGLALDRLADRRIRTQEARCPGSFPGRLPSAAPVLIPTARGSAAS